MAHDAAFGPRWFRDRCSTERERPIVSASASRWLSVDLDIAAQLPDEQPGDLPVVMEHLFNEIIQQMDLIQLEAVEHFFGFLSFKPGPPPGGNGPLFK